MTADRGDDQLEAELWAAVVCIGAACGVALVLALTVFGAWALFVPCGLVVLWAAWSGTA